jgi:hypothetical protein
MPPVVAQRRRDRHLEAGFELRIPNIECRISKYNSSLLAVRYSAFDIQSWQIQGGQPVSITVVED